MWIYGGTLIPDHSEVAGVRALEAADPTFSLDAFCAFVGDLHRHLHRAAAEGALDSVGPVLDGAARAVVAEQVATDPAWSAPVDRVDHTAVLTAEIDPPTGHDVLTVRVGARIGGREVVEDWVLARPSVRDDQAPAVPATCSACGGPRSLDDHGACRWCGTSLRGVAGGWRVIAITPPRPLDTSTSATKASRATDAAAVDTDLVGFVGSVVLAVHRAAAAGDLAPVARVVSPSLRTRAADPADDLAWDLSIDEIEEVSPIDIRRGPLEVLTVRVHLRAGDLRTAEDWTFERPTPSAGGSAPLDECPVCGAPVELDDDGGCRHCGTHLRGVAGSWRATRAVRPPGLVSAPWLVRLVQRRWGQRLVAALVLVVLAASLAGLVWLVVVAIS